MEHRPAPIVPSSVMNYQLFSGCMRQCLVFGLTAVTFVLAMVGVGLWFASAALPPPGFGTLLAAGLLLASTGIGVVLVCAAFCAIEKLTGPLFS